MSTQGTIPKATTKAWSGHHFVVKEKRFTLGRQYYVSDGQGRPLAFCKQKMFKLREDIRFYTDESKTKEIFRIAATKIIDFNAALQVIDSATGQVIGRLARKGWKSILKDEWRIMDGAGRPVGRLHEDSTAMALVRRFVPYGQLIPDKYSLLLGPEGQERPAGAIKERFQLFGDTYDLTMHPGAQYDPRVLVALTVCIDGFEGE